MKKQYQIPELKVSQLESTDIIVTSLAEGELPIY